MTRQSVSEIEQRGLLDAGFDRSISALTASRDRLQASMLEAAALMTGTFALERTVLVAGNGGSAAQALHLAAELVGRYKLSARPGLPVIPLCADAATMTAWSNDVGYDEVFARGVEAFGRPGDLLIGISTSGRSRNLVRAFETARSRSVRTLGLLGGDGGELAALSDVAIVVPSRDTQSIQDVHGTVVHLLCELVERRLVESGWFPLAALAASSFAPVGAPRSGPPRMDAKPADGGRKITSPEAARWPTR